MNLLNYLKNIQPCDCCDEGNVISSEPIQRSNGYCTQYGKWLKFNKYNSMLEAIYKASLKAKEKKCSQTKEKDAAINFLMISKINGFTMQYDPKRWEEEDFRYLFEYIAITLMQEHGFDKFSSMKEVTKYSDRVETVERYKLKSSQPNVDYSDIMIRLCHVNNKITTIKFCATCNKQRITHLPNLLQKLIKV